MKNQKLLILIVLLYVVTVGETCAQQQVMFTQYMFNSLALNPAYAGSHETISASTLIREQWVGVEGAPSTKTFSLHSPVINNQIGIGLLFLNDKIGVIEQNALYFSYSYKILLSNGGKLAMGLQMGFSDYNARYSEVSTSDPVFSGGDASEFQPNFGAGLYYYTNKMYIGASIPQLAQSNFDSNSNDSDSKLIRHYFFTAGYVIDLTPSLKLKPNTLLKVVKGAPLQLDLNANLLINEFLWVGVSWRSFDSFDALFQLQLTDQLQLGYAFDFATTSKLRRVNSGSHEIMINYRFSFKKDKMITPRYF